MVNTAPQVVTAPKAFIEAMVHPNSLDALDSGQHVSISGGLVAYRQSSGTNARYKLYADSPQGRSRLRKLAPLAEAARLENTARKNGLGKVPYKPRTSAAA